MCFIIAIVPIRNIRTLKEMPTGNAGIVEVLNLTLLLSRICVQEHKTEHFFFYSHMRSVNVCC